MNEIVFRVRIEAEGGFSAAWDEPDGGGISTQGDDLAELQAMIRDAVLCHFEDKDLPTQFKLHFEEDPAFALA